MNELLKEARDTLDDELYGIQNDSVSDGLKRIAEKEALIARIDAALSTPEPDVMELDEDDFRNKAESAFEKWEKGSRDYSDICPKYGQGDRALKAAGFIDGYLEAAALIEAHGKQVPRAMLEEVIFDAYGKGLVKRILNGNEVDEIIAKYNYTIKE